MWQTVSPYVGLQLGRKKLLSLEVRIFFITTVTNSTNNLSPNQLSNNILEQAYKSQPLVNLNANELYSTHRHEVYNKTDDKTVYLRFTTEISGD